MWVETQKQWMWYALAIALLLAVTVFAVNQLAFASPPAQEQYVWCFDTIMGEDGRHTLGRPPSVVPPYLAGAAKDNLVQSVCFRTWSEAASYITDGRVRLPADATEQDYIRATDGASSYYMMNDET